MTRFSLSFLSIFLLLAVLAVSMPIKRDGEAPSQPLSLDKLTGVGRLMDGLKSKGSSNKEQASPSNNDNKNAEVEAKIAAAEKLAEKAEAKDKPSPTERKVSSGNFATPTASATHKPTSQPNELGRIPLVGGILGGSGAGL